ncbi:MAG: ATP-binding cassette domain-containing protein, partial [Chloroflexi bacterium]|nr:ATP-binding cassette domain-containing protein [Chloroflexota bacterium]
VRSLVSLVWPQERPIAMAALARVGIAERAPVRAGRLSGGEQQRVAIARLLVQDPAIMLADEPVASLDPARADEIMQLLAGVAVEGGKTVVASMHLVDLARRYFTRLIGLRNGVVEFDLPAGAVTDAMLERLYDTHGLRDDGGTI